MKRDAGAEAWAALSQLFLSDENHERFHHACESVGLSPPALKALLSLNPGEGKSMRMLATKWRCDASWVTSLIDALEERGLVERRAVPEDRRVKTVVLTEKGVLTKAEALDHLEVAPPAMAALTEAERRQLRDLLRKLVAATGAGG